LARGLEFVLPDGWIACGWRFEVETTSPQQQSLIQQHFGARRFAYNWALATVKANLDARAADPSVPLLAWTLPTLRKAWNQAKVTVAPWWSSCSKEAYACGIADLTVALHNWSASKHSRRGGRKVGFPRFKARHRDHGRVRFSTGAMRLESDRRHLTLPVVGRLRSKESTRRLERKVARGQARVLSMTLSEHAGRLFISVASIVVLVARSPREPHARCGIDLGVGTEWAVIAHADGMVERIPHPIQWASVQKQHRRLARRASRRTVGSRGHREAKTKLAALDRRAANLRRESIHTLTTRLTRRYGTIVVEDLDIAAMARGMGRRAFRRSVHAAGLGQIRPTMAYKSAWRGCTLVVADRWFASSKIHHECGGYHATSSSPTADGYAPDAAAWWTATQMRPATSVTGPDRSPTGMFSGVELPPRCRSWATTTDRLTQGRGRERPQKTTERWRRPMTPEPNPILGRGTPHRGARKGATQMRAELVTVG
jgi:putative transposase